MIAGIIKMCNTPGCTRHSYTLSDGTKLKYCGPCWFKKEASKVFAHSDKEIRYDGDGRPLCDQCYQPYSPRVSHQKTCSKKSCQKAAALERTHRRRDRLINE